MSTIHLLDEKQICIERRSTRLYLVALLCSQHASLLLTRALIYRTSEVHVDITTLQSLIRFPSVTRFDMLVNCSCTQLIQRSFSRLANRTQVSSSVLQVILSKTDWLNLLFAAFHDHKRSVSRCLHFFWHSLWIFSSNVNHVQLSSTGVDRCSRSFPPWQ